jgi:membrane protease YdiL (CAAX protease family)
MKDSFKKLLSLIGFLSFTYFVVFLLLPDRDGWAWTYLTTYMSAGAVIWLIDVVRLPWTYTQDEPDLVLLRPWIWDLFFIFSIPLFPFVMIFSEIKSRREAREQG